ncbi:MAG: ROK family protein [Rhodocyclaceae bacterium]|nr:ROK family protein [Rhodocyclaceae bacterium]
MNVPPPLGRAPKEVPLGDPKAGQFKPGGGKADEPLSPPFSERGLGGKPILLCGDIGGSKTLLGLARDGEVLVDRRVANADFEDFAGLLAAFFIETQTDPSLIGGGCLAVAGPIADDGRSARLTNLPWSIDSDALSHRFGLPALRLANDFAAAALGAVTASSAQRVTLQEGEPLATAPRLVVGAGTGLGMAIVLPQDETWRIVAGEGGHVAFAPADEQQMALWAFLHARHGRVTWERVVSGPGLTAIHEFVAGAELPPEEIATRAALVDPASPNSAERRSLDLFLAAYGAFAGDMALACLARGGVFLAGGIAAGLLPVLRQSGFLAAFNAKAEHAAIAARIPIHVATDPVLGLHGALLLAREEEPVSAGIVPRAAGRWNAMRGGGSTA